MITITTGDRRRAGNERQAIARSEFFFHIACKTKEKRLCASWAQCTKT